MSSMMKENAVEHYSDRFIPSRSGSRIDDGFVALEEAQARISMGGRPGSPDASGAGSGQAGPATADGRGSPQPTLNMLLRAELLGDTRVPPRGSPTADSGRVASASGGGASRASPQSHQPQPNIFRFKVKMGHYLGAGHTPSARCG